MGGGFPWSSLSKTFDYWNSFVSGGAYFWVSWMTNFFQNPPVVNSFCVTLVKSNSRFPTSDGGFFFWTLSQSLQFERTHPTADDDLWIPLVKRQTFLRFPGVGSPLYFPSMKRQPFREFTKCEDVWILPNLGGHQNREYIFVFPSWKIRIISNLDYWNAMIPYGI